MQLTVEEIARICHEVNKAYCEAIGDASQKTWGEAEDWQRQSAINGVSAHAGWLSKGLPPDPALGHRLWLEDKWAAGWKYGAVKDSARKEHPCMVSWEELPQEQRIKDVLFSAIVKACVNMGVENRH